MRSGSLSAAVAIAAALAPLAASATGVPAAGTVSAVVGHAFVARDGRLLRARPAMRLRRGDRIVTREDGSARVRLREGCDVAIGASASAVIGACGDTPVTDFAARPTAPGGAGAGTYAVALAGAAGAMLGVVAAAQNGGQPNSP